MQCVLVGPSAPLRGGIAIDNDARAQALRLAGHKVEQINFSRLYPQFFFPGRSQHDAAPDHTQTSALACLDSLNPLSWWRTARHIAAWAPDVVTFQWWHPLFAPCYISVLSALRKALPRTARVLISHHARPHEPLPGQDLALRWVAQRCTDVIVHSRTDSDLIKTLVPDTRVHFLDYPLLETPQSQPDREEAQRRLEVSGRVLLFFGDVRTYKGLDILLHALAKVPRELGVSLLVAGEFYTSVDATRSLIQSLHLNDRVRIIDRYISEPEWPALFAATDALVLPYRAASQSMTIPLAYGFGKPVIATRVGGFPDIIEDGQTGVLADPDSDDVARAIQHFYTDFLSGPYDTAIATKRQSFGWEPFIQLLEQCSASHGQTVQAATK